MLNYSSIKMQKEINMIIPERLQKGDTIGVIAPAGPTNLERLNKAFPFLENMGLKIKLGRYIEEVYGYLAGKDHERLADFHEMIADPEIKAIIFARGGYGTARFTANINFDLIRQNPKIIWGYSDITYLHTAIRQATGLVTFHGPMLASDIAKDDFDKLSASSFRQLFEPTELTYTEQISPLEVLVPGKGNGQLVGGNLSLLTCSIGTPYEIDIKDKLLFIEDIGEVPYEVDAMLNQLKYSGKLAEAAGIIIGDFADAEPKNHRSLSLEEVFHHYFSGLGCPVMSGFKIGHCFPHFSVPMGVNAEMNTKNKTLTINPGVI